MPSPERVSLGSEPVLSHHPSPTGRGEASVDMAVSAFARIETYATAAFFSIGIPVLALSITTYPSGN